MDAIFSRWADSLTAAGLVQASEKPGHFFRRLSDSTAFVLNVTPEDWGLDLHFGFASIPVNAAQSGMLDYFSQVGFDSADCILRFTQSLYAPEEEETVRNAVSEIFHRYASCSKADLLARSGAMRKQFFARITALLAPLGFRKKGNKWTLPLENPYLLEFYAQKSAYSDQYYFNISVYPAGKPFPGCLQLRLRSANTECFDWQLIPEEFFDRLFSSAVRQILLPVRNIPAAELPQLQSRFSAPQFSMD